MSSSLTENTKINKKGVLEISEKSDVLVFSNPNCTTLTGRIEISTSASEINKSNVSEVVRNSICIHSRNVGEINMLWNYFTGNQAVLNRTKRYATTINNKVVENHAYKAVEFKSSYEFAFPIKYACRGDSKKSEPISHLERYMREANKYTCDGHLAQWMYICGQAYRFIQPTSENTDEKPFNITSVDPRKAFVIYGRDVFSTPLAGVIITSDEKENALYNVYTKTEMFVLNNKYEVVSSKYHVMGGLPLIEYILNPERMGVFEPVIPLLDAINELESNRIDAVAQTVDSLTVILNADVDQEIIDSAGTNGILLLKGTAGSGLSPDAKLLKYDISHTDIQVTIAHMIDTAQQIMGIPDQKNRNGGGGDTGQAVSLRTGWNTAHARAMLTEKFFNKSERELIKIALTICKKFVPSKIKELRATDIDIKMPRSLSDNMQVKAQTLATLLACGVEPASSLQAVELFADDKAVADNSPNLGKNIEMTVALNMAELPVEAQKQILDKKGIQVDDFTVVQTADEHNPTSTGETVELNRENDNKKT